MECRNGRGTSFAFSGLTKKKRIVPITTSGWVDSERVKRQQLGLSRYDRKPHLIKAKQVERHQERISIVPGPLHRAN